MDKIIVTLEKHIVVLYPSEIKRLLLNEPELYIKCIKRGKSEKRIEACTKRMERNSNSE